MFCTRVKEFLQSSGVEFEDRDITQDEEALEELASHGFMTTPVVTIDGEAVIGYDPRRMSQLLELD